MKSYNGTVNITIDDFLAMQKVSEAARNTVSGFYNERESLNVLEVSLPQLAKLVKALDETERTEFSSKSNYILKVENSKCVDRIMDGGVVLYNQKDSGTIELQIKKIIELKALSNKIDVSDEIKGMYEGAKMIFKMVHPQLSQELEKSL